MKVKIYLHDLDRSMRSDGSRRTAAEVCRIDDIITLRWDAISDNLFMQLYSLEKRIARALLKLSYGKKRK